MTNFPLRRRALSIYAALAFLAGCSGFQGQNGTIPQGVAANHIRVASGSGNCPALPGGTGVLPDGDFSRVQIPPGSGLVYDKGQIFAPEWVVAKDSINFLGMPYWSLDGLCSVDLDGQGDPNPVGAIESSGFKTKRGEHYNVFFIMSGNGFCSPITKTLEVSAAAQFTEFTWNTSGGNNIQNGDYASESWSFVASKPVTTIKLASEDPKGSACGPVVGGVAITKT